MRLRRKPFKWTGISAGAQFLHRQLAAVHHQPLQFSLPALLVEAWKDKYGEFSREQLMCLVDQFEQANVADIALTGGEPLMSPYFKEFVRYLAAKRIGFTEIFTNAALIDDEVLDVIAEAGFRPYFKVSFDCSGSHDYMRGVVGAEESTLRGIRLLRKRGFSVTVITSIDKVVIGGLIDTLHLLASLGVDNWWMAPPMEIGAWRGTDSGVDMKSLLPALKGVLVEWLKCGRPFDMMLWRWGNTIRRGRSSAACRPLRARASIAAAYTACRMWRRTERCSPVAVIRAASSWASSPICLKRR